MLSFLEMRNLLMSQHGWCRRVATIAARLYTGVDTPADLEAATVGRYGRALVTEGEYVEICRAR
jgi:hypothetical protein